MIEFSHSYVQEEDNGIRNNYCCSGKIKNEPIGYCRYYSTDESNNIIYIEYIYIYQHQRRKGYATEFVKELQKKHTLNWDYQFTNEGREWYDSLINRKIIG